MKILPTKRALWLLFVVALLAVGLPFWHQAAMNTIKEYCTKCEIYKPVSEIECGYAVWREMSTWEKICFWWGKTFAPRETASWGVVLLLRHLVWQSQKFAPPLRNPPIDTPIGRRVCATFGIKYPDCSKEYPFLIYHWCEADSNFDLISKNAQPYVSKWYWKIYYWLHD